MLLLIPLLPFVGFLVNACFGKRLPKSTSGGVACLAMVAAFVAFGRQQGTVDGQIITFFVMTVAAAEAAVGLALVIGLFRHRESLNPEAFTSLKW